MDDNANEIFDFSYSIDDATVAFAIGLEPTRIKGTQKRRYLYNRCDGLHHPVPTLLLHSLAGLSWQFQNEEAKNSVTL